MRRRLSLAVLLLVALTDTFALSLAPSTKLTASEAKNHIGERATVCGLVVDGRYLAKSKGQPTLINFEKPYPDQTFTLLIWGDHRKQFGEPERELKGKRVCVTGLIKIYNGKPEIAATAKSQVSIED